MATAANGKQNSSMARSASVVSLVPTGYTSTGKVIMSLVTGKTVNLQNGVSEWSFRIEEYLLEKNVGRETLRV
jgi:hypothetical protein